MIYLFTFYKSTDLKSHRINHRFKLALQQINTADVACNPKPSNRAMQSPCVDAFNTFGSLSQTIRHLQLLGTRTKPSSPRRRYGSYPCLSCDYNDQSSVLSEDLWTRRRHRGEFKVGCKREKVNTKGKDNVWSVDNEMAKVEKGKERIRRRKSKEGKRVRNVNRKGDRVMVSASMLTEVETVLQTQVISRDALNSLVLSFCQSENFLFYALW